MGMYHSVEDSYQLLSLDESEHSIDDEAKLVASCMHRLLTRSYRFDHFDNFPLHLIDIVIEYAIRLDFIALYDMYDTLAIQNNAVMKVSNLGCMGGAVYSLAFLPVAFDETNISRFNFQIVHLECNVVFGCLMVYKTMSESIVHKLLRKQSNESFQANCIGYNGYSYDCSGLLIHNNNIHGMNAELSTGCAFAMQYNPHTKQLHFFVNNALQETKFENVVVPKSKVLMPIIGLSSKNECIKIKSYDVM